MSRLRVSTLLFSLLFPALAGADSVAIYELRFSRVPPALVEDIRAKIKGGLTEAGYVVMSQDLARAKVDEQGIPPGCSVGPCLERVGRALNVQRVVSGGVSAQGTSFDIVLTMLETGGGTPLAQVAERCDVCNFNEVEDAVATATKRLHSKALVYLDTRARLTVASDPSGAKVLLDTMPIGSTPLTRVLAPGEHTLEVAHAGHASLSRRVTLSPGKSQTLRVRLIPRDKLTSGRRRRQRTGVAPWFRWAMLGGGVVMGGVGGGLLAMDGTETSDARYVRDTRAAGVALISVGTVAVVTATLLTVLELRALPRAGEGRGRSTTALLVGEHAR